MLRIASKENGVCEKIFQMGEARTRENVPDVTTLYSVNKGDSLYLHRSEGAVYTS